MSFKCPQCSTELFIGIAFQQPPAIPERWAGTSADAAFGPALPFPGTNTLPAEPKEREAIYSGKPDTGQGVVGDLLERINDDECDAKSKSFMHDTRIRYEKWGEKILLSPAQMKWLEGLAK